MHVKRYFLKSVFLIVVASMLSNCSVVEGVHQYFNQDSKNRSAEKESSNDSIESVVYIVKSNDEKLSDIAYKLSGSRNTDLIKKANPKIKTDSVEKGTSIRIPISILKSNLKSASKTPLKDPVKDKKPDLKVTPTKQNKKTPLSRNVDVEILPGEDESLKQKGVKDNYYDTPFRNDDVDIVPYQPTKSAKPKLSKEEQEEIKLRDKYKDIMKELE